MPGKSVIVDTNALLIPGEFGVDIFAELERLGYTSIIVPRNVLNELEVLRGRASLKGKERRAAAVGYALLQDYVRDTNKSRRERCGCTILLEAEVEEEGESDTDTAIILLAARRGAAVLTNDEVLRRRLTDAGIVTVYLRGRTRLEERE